MIAGAGERFAKTLYSTKESAELPYLVSAEDEAAQASYVADHVLEHREAGIALKRQAVLFRAAHHSDLLEIELGRRNIPFVKYGGLKFLEAVVPVQPSVLCSELERPFFVPSPANWSPERAEGVKDAEGTAKRLVLDA